MRRLLCAGALGLCAVALPPASGATARTGEAGDDLCAAAAVLVEDGRLDDALDELVALLDVADAESCAQEQIVAVATARRSAEELYDAGKEAEEDGDDEKALESYDAAAALDGGSPAVAAAAAIRDVRRDGTTGASRSSTTSAPG